MARPLQELADLQQEHGGVPIFYAGDIFDRWNVGPETINFALAHLPRGYAVPGQHDLPDHAYDHIRRSAYWTLVEAGRVINLPPDEAFTDSLWFDEPVVRGFPWGFPPRPVDPIPGKLQLAVIHRFVWTDGTGYAGAPAERRLGAYSTALNGYTAAVFGDNHKGFLARTRAGVAVFNAGALMRRKTDEIGYEPRVGLLRADGTISEHYLDTTHDIFTLHTQAEVRVAELLDMGAFMDKLRDLGGAAADGLDFMAALEQFFRDNTTPQPIRDIILHAATEGAQ